MKEGVTQVEREIECLKDRESNEGRIREKVIVRDTVGVRGKGRGSEGVR